MAIVSFHAAYAQDKTMPYDGKKHTQNPPKDSTLWDVYNGNIRYQDTDYIVRLMLYHHCKYCDEGTVFLTKTWRVAKHKTGIHGDWTVLKGSATNDNATVVELDMADGETLYYLRLKNSDLQQLDSTLHEIKPEQSYILRKCVRAIETTAAGCVLVGGQKIVIKDTVANKSVTK